MIGSSGNDTLIGTAGNDTLTGGSGNDTITGGGGDDLILGDTASGIVASGSVTNGSFAAGTDGWTIVTNPSAGNVYAVTGSLSALGFNGANGVAGGVAQQTVTTTPGAIYTLGYMIGETATGTGTQSFRIDILDAGGNVIATRLDTVANDSTANLAITYTANSAATTIRITNTATSSTTNSDGYIDNIVNVLAPVATDRMSDSLSGGTGNDTLFGGPGADTLIGDAGDDVLDGGAGSDSLVGGAGDDRFTFTSIENDAGPNTTATFSPGTVTPVLINTGTATSQSPPKMIVLDDGRVMYVWTNNADLDNSAQMTVQVRIFNANGTPSTNQISLDSWVPADGDASYDWDNLDLDKLANGNVVISYVRGTGVTGTDKPVFGILQPTATGVTTVVSPIAIPSNTATTLTESPPVTTALLDGNVLFTWSKNAQADDATNMFVMGRVYNPTTQTWLGPEFRIGDVAVDGSTAIVPSLTVTQLTGGNIVVGWARSNAETGFNEPVYTVISPTGVSLLPTLEVEGTDNETQGTPWESPPVITALTDGRWIASWVNDGYSDDSANMTLEVRIFNADGTAASGDIRIGTTAVDGSGFKTPNVTMISLPNGRVAIGYVETNATDGNTKPFLAILDTATGQVIKADVDISPAPSHPWPGPPQLFAIGNSGYFAAVYADGNAFSGTSFGLKYRVYDQDGNAVTGENVLTAATGNSSVSGGSSFDWSSFTAVYNASNQTMTFGWVGTSDGSGTGVYSSGPISMSFFTDPPRLTRDEIVVGGETNELVGDTLDLKAVTQDVTLVFTATEAGTVTAVTGGQRISFSEIERIELGGGNDSATGSAAADYIAAGGGNDTLVGGAGSDTLSGETGNDRIYGGDGNDSLSGGAGIDSLFGGAGNDSIAGGSGADVLDGGAGDDSFLIEAGFGNDSIIGGETEEFAGDTLDARAVTENLSVTFGTAEAGQVTGASGSVTFAEIERVLLGSGSDTVTGSAGADYVDAGAGNDSLSGGAGNDTLFGGAGNDSIAGGSGADVLDGGGGDDSFLIGAGFGNDSIIGGETEEFAGDTLDARAVTENLTVLFGSAEAGLVTGASGGITFSQIEHVLLGSGSDTVTGSAGADHVDAGAGNDSLSGGAGSDSLFGGAGNDTIAGGGGNDLLAGGAGTDVFKLQEGGGSDVIADFEIDRVDGRSVDRLDISGLTTATGGPIYWRDVTVTDTVGDGSGDAVLTFPDGQSVILQGVSRSAVTGRSNLGAIGIPCFASGTPVLTPSGWRKIEDIRIGDPVLTREGKKAAVMWAGSRDLDREELDARPSLLPVLIKPGVLGNRQEVRLSQQHAVLMRIGKREVLVRAIHLARSGYGGVRIARGTQRIVYHHILLPDHALLDIGGMPAESLYPGRHALGPLSRLAQTEIASTVILLRGDVAERVVGLDDIAAIYGPKSWPVLTGAEVAKAVRQGVLRPAAMAAMMSGQMKKHGTPKAERDRTPNARGNTSPRLFVDAA